MARHEITDEQYARIEHLLPGKATDRGVTARDNREFINAVLWIDRVGGPWRGLPGVLSGYMRNVNIAASNQPFYALKAVLQCG